MIRGNELLHTPPRAASIASTSPSIHAAKSTDRALSLSLPSLAVASSATAASPPGPGPSLARRGRQFHWSSAIPAFLNKPTSSPTVNEASARSPTAVIKAKRRSPSPLPPRRALPSPPDQHAIQHDPVPPPPIQPKRDQPAILHALASSHRLARQPTPPIPRSPPVQKHTFLVGPACVPFTVPTAALSASRMLTHWLASCGPFCESRDNAYRLPTIDPASFSAILAHLANPSTWRPPVDLCLVIMLDALYLDLHAAVDACLATAAENVDDVESLEGVPVPLIMAIARRLDVPALARADSIIGAAGGDTRRVWLDHLARAPDVLDALHRVDMARIESVVAYLTPPVPRSALQTAGDVTRAIALPAILSADEVAWIRTVAHRASRPVELVLDNGATVPAYVPPPAAAEKLLARRKVTAQYSSRGKLAVETTATTTVSAKPKDDFPDSSDTFPPTVDAIRTATPIRVVASGTDFTLHPSTPSLLLTWPITRLTIRSTPLSTPQITNLCTWLGSPHSAVTHLSLTHGTLDESTLAHLLACLPRTPPTHLDFAHNTHQSTPSRGDKALVHALRAWCRALPRTAGVDLSLACNSFLPALAMSLVATLAAHADRFVSLRVAHVPLAAALDASAISPLWFGMTAVDLVGTRVHAPVLAGIVARLAECATRLTDVRFDAASDAVVGAIARAVPGWTYLHVVSVTAAAAPVLVADETFGMLADAIAGHRAVEVVDWTGLDVPETAIGTVIASGGGRRLTVVLGDVETRMHARLGKMVAAVGKGGKEVVLWTGVGMVTNIHGARRR